MVWDSVQARRAFADLTMLAKHFRLCMGGLLQEKLLKYNHDRG